MFWKKKATGPGMGEAGVQSLVHAMELGAAAKYIKGALSCLTIILLLVWYIAIQFKGFDMAEAMDYAQLARNIKRGEGFTTKFIRPVSAWKMRVISGDCKLKDSHPDAFNAPLFPYLMATVFKVTHPSFQVKNVANQPFTKFYPEIIIVAVSELFLLGSAALTYLLALQLFDKRIAMVSVFLLLFSDLLLRYSISGLPTIVLLFLFLAVQLCLLNAHLRVAQEEKKVWVWGFSGVAGLLCGLCLLTKYSAGWLVLPVAAYAMLAFGKHRWVCLALIAAFFVAVVTPWLWRNNQLTGKFFGLAAFATIEQTDRYQNDQLQRGFKEIGEPGAKTTAKKYLTQSRGYVEDYMWKSGAGLLGAFFLVGLLYRFRKTETLFMRRFIWWTSILAVIVSGFGSVISASKDFPANPSNLLVLLCPGVIIFGTAFFYLLLDRVNLQSTVLKRAAVVLFVLICASPMIYSLLPPRRGIIRYPSPPYYEPIIAQIARWVQPQELMMTDMPWALAWYGDRKALWLPYTLEDFYQINDYNQRVVLMYLSPISLDRRFLSESARKSADLRPWWPWLTLRPPRDFPLQAFTPLPGFEPDPLFPDHLVFADRTRWLEEKR